MEARSLCSSRLALDRERREMPPFRSAWLAAAPGYATRRLSIRHRCASWVDCNGRRGRAFSKSSEEASACIPARCTSEGRLHDNFNGGRTLEVDLTGHPHPSLPDAECPYRTNAGLIRS